MIRAILVCGGRDYADRARVFSVLDQLHAASPISGLAHGACGWDGDDEDFDEAALRGADRWAHEWAGARHMAVFLIAARWRALGRRAGPIRNALLLDGARPDLVVAFPGHRGTTDMVGKARKAGVDVLEVRP